MFKGARLSVAIDALDHDGAGVGSADGRRVHVAFAVPGDRVEAEVEHLSPHGLDAWARLVEVRAPSAQRVPPACRAYGRCGGCVLQALAYPAQLEHKRARLAEALAAAGLSVEPGPCVASPRPLGYRDKSKLVVAADEGRVILGAFAPRSHEVVDLSGCAVAEPPLDELASTVAELATRLGVRPFDERSARGDLRHVVLRVSARGEVMAVLVVARRGIEAIARLGRALRAARPEVIGVVENLHAARGNVLFGEVEPDVVLDGTGVLDEFVGGTRLRLSARAFFQVNRALAALLYADVAAAAALGGVERVVDVYCGVGGIALTLAPRAAAVVGIEEHAGAVADAAAGAALNHVSHARFFAGDAAALLGDPSVVGDRADVVVLNPPRKGCDPAVLAAAAKLAPRTILYVSCSPTTLALDLAALGPLGYRARRVTPYDMLPHTPHVEALAVIER